MHEYHKFKVNKKDKGLHNEKDIFKIGLLDVVIIDLFFLMHKHMRKTKENHPI